MSLKSLNITPHSASFYAYDRHDRTNTMSRSYARAHAFDKRLMHKMDRRAIKAITKAEIVEEMTGLYIDDIYDDWYDDAPPRFKAVHFDGRQYYAYDTDWQPIDDYWMDWQ